MTWEIYYNKLQDFELLKFLNQLNRFGKSDEEIHSYLNLSGIYNQKNSLDNYLLMMKLFN